MGKRWKPKPRITDSQMREIVADYHRLMPPGWSHYEGDTLARMAGPFVHAIGFEALSGGAYRPMNYVAPLVTREREGRAGASHFLFAFPSGRPQTSSLRAHKDAYERLFANMKREFLPPIDVPLEARSLLRLCQRHARPTCVQAYGLAALHAYFGNDRRARCWCWRYPRLVNAVRTAWQRYDYERQEFLDLLVQWLDAGTAKEHLEAILQEQRSKWHLV